MVSLKTIAQKCGVSTATVSKALNGHKDIAKRQKTGLRKLRMNLDIFQMLQPEH